MNKKTPHTHRKKNEAEETKCTNDTTKKWQKKHAKTQKTQTHKQYNNMKRNKNSNV